MRDEGRGIFRADAVRHYMQRREKSVLPKLTPPRTFVYLLGLFALLLTSLLLAYFARVPAYVSGEAVVVDSSVAGQGAAGGGAMAAFFPPEALPRLRAGGRLFIASRKGGERLPANIKTVEPRLYSTDEARRRFGLADTLLKGSEAVAVVWVEPRPSGSTEPTQAGAAFEVEAEVGSHRIISLLPLVGKLFGE